MAATVVFHVPWGHYLPSLAEGLLKTMEFMIAGLVLAVTLGLVIALLRLSKSSAARGVAATYTEIFKNVPLLAIIFLSYFGLGSLGFKLGVFEAGCLSLMVFYAAYLSEIFRAAISGVDPGQREASEALGMGRLDTFSHVVFPQALRLALPGTNTMAVDLLKSTSLLVTISAAELMTQGSLIASETFQALEVYLVIAVIYFALCYPISQGLLWIERRVRAGKPMTLGRRRLLRDAEQRLQDLTNARMEVVG